MMPRALSASLAGALLSLTACGLRPVYAGGSESAVASTLRSVSVAPIAGQSGWLMRNKLVDRLGEGGSGSPAYQLDVTIDDNITSFGLRGSQAATRERRTLRARYRLVDLRNGMVVLDATAGSDAGIDIVRSRTWPITLLTKSSLGSRFIRLERRPAGEAKQAIDQQGRRPAQS